MGFNQDSPRARLEVLNYDASGTSVLGASTGTGGIGVSGTNATASGVGVYGANNGGGLAGLFDGKVQVNGTLTASAFTGPVSGTLTGPLVVTTSQASTILGSLGVGTANPTVAKLEVHDSSIGVAVGGISTNAYGVSGQSTSGTGVFGQGGGYAMYANGNTGQNRADGGWVKAMIYVTEDGAIV